MKPVLGILLGETAGIGPEIVAKLCAADRLTPYCRPLLIGDARVLQMGQQIAGAAFPFAVVKDPREAVWPGPVPVYDLANIDPASVALGKIDPHSGRVTGDSLIEATRLLKAKVIDGLVYAPLNKEAFQRGGHRFPEEHRLIAHYLGWEKPFGEMNVLNDLWTSRVTSHVPLREVAALISTDGILQAVRLAHGTLTRAGIAAPRIAVAALNPHAGEGGLCGREEVEIIGPAVKAAVGEGINALGPFSADTVFINAFKGDYDAVVTMYHDQGQIAMKLMGFQFGVTVMAGIPFAVTTPAHGTAFDIAGQGVARPDAMEQAVKIAARMAGWRCH